MTRAAAIEATLESKGQPHSGSVPDIVTDIVGDDHGIADRLPEF